jgi:hypothetical protein
VAASVLSGTVAAPIAHADPLDNIRGAVNGARAQSTCGPLNYSFQLEAAAQDLARAGNSMARINPHGYPGLTSGIANVDDPTNKATAGLVAQDDLNIKDCANRTSAWACSATPGTTRAMSPSCWANHQPPSPQRILHLLSLLNLLNPRRLLSLLRHSR